MFLSKHFEKHFATLADLSAIALGIFAVF